MSRGRYNPDPRWGGRKRDVTWPSEIAGARPALVTRIHCDEPYEEMDPRNTLRGRPIEPDRPMPFESEELTVENQVARFNRSLREGLGTGRPDNNDE
jgi:hypothetical protein